VTSAVGSSACTRFTRSWRCGEAPIGRSCWPWVGGERPPAADRHVPKPMYPHRGRSHPERIIRHPLLWGNAAANFPFAVNYKAVRESRRNFEDAHDSGRDRLLAGRPAAWHGRSPLLAPAPRRRIRFLVLNGISDPVRPGQACWPFHARGDYRATVGIHEYTHRFLWGVRRTSTTTASSKSAKAVRGMGRHNAGVYVLNPADVSRAFRRQRLPLHC